MPWAWTPTSLCASILLCVNSIALAIKESLIKGMAHSGKEHPGGRGRANPSSHPRRQAPDYWDLLTSKSGLKLHTHNTPAEVVKDHQTGLLTLRMTDGKVHEGLDVILMAVGRAPNVDHLNMEF